MLFNPLWGELYQNPVQFFSVISCGVPLPHSNALQYYIKREKCKVNDVIFLSCCEARSINLDNKNMKISIFTGGTSIRSKNIFTAIYDILPEGMKLYSIHFLIKLVCSLVENIVGKGVNPC